MDGKSQRSVALIVSGPDCQLEIDVGLKHFNLTSFRFESVTGFLDSTDVLLRRWSCIILELNRAEETQLSALHRLRQRACKVPILAILRDQESAITADVFRCGADDVLSAPIGGPELCTRIVKLIAVADSRRFRVDPPEADSGLNRLTRCERQVLEGVLCAKTTKQISNELQVGPQTIAKHKQSLLRKMGARNEVALVLQLLSPETHALARLA